jgi:hypothetical protein
MRRAAPLARLALALVAGCGGGKGLKPASSLPVVVIPSPSDVGWVRLLRSTGWAAGGGTVADATHRTGAVVPSDAVLSDDQLSQLQSWVKHGGRLATANHGVLAKLGFARGPALTATGATGGLWAEPQQVRPFAAGEGDQVLAVSKPVRKPLIVARRIGSGLAVALAVDPVAGGRAGFELFPNGATLVGRLLGAPVGPSVQSAEVFVDPGGLHDSIKGSPAKIADLLARAGTRIAQIAGWNYDFNDPANDYDYGALIDALHARGILAYAWLEPPFVTLRLWQDEPQCRERTATGREAMVDWRSLIALYIPKCMQAAQASWQRILTKYPWDGVNVAELYFEPDIKDRNFTPFTPYALKLFGKDPKTHRDEFFAWRKTLVTKLNDEVLRFVNGLPNAKHFGMELTVIDDQLDPDLGHQVGSDVAALAGVAQRNGAALIVEDPFTSWSEGPLRYDRLGPHVRRLMPPQSSLIDVNVVPRIGGPRPTVQMEGSELGLALGSATAKLGRLAIYSLGTLTAADLDLLPHAMAASTVTTDAGVFGGWTVKVSSPREGWDRLKVDGVPWPSGDGVALVPPGNHVVTWSKGDPYGPGLTAFGGELGTATASSSKLTFTYVARPDALAVVTAEPKHLFVDGDEAPLRVVRDPAGGWVVRVPTGRHEAELDF